MTPLSLLLVGTLFTLIGCCLGILTGLIPGFHVNTVSFLILSFQSVLVMFSLTLIGGFDPSMEYVIALISVLIIGCVVTHTFLNFIPATYLGAPEGETALSVLPAHRMLLEGKGYEAIKASALGSLGASMFALLLILPARLIMSSPVNLYEKLVPFIPLILFFVVSILVLQEGATLLDYREKLVAIGIFLLSGFLGFSILSPGGISSYVWAPFEQEGLSNASVLLFPLFTGLFGISNLLVSLMDNPEIPEQQTDDIEIGLEDKNKIRGTIAGTFSGGLVGWLPGITGAAATAVTRIFLSNDDSEEIQSKEYIMSVSAVDTSCAIFTIVALFVIMKARSGAMQAVFKLNEDFLSSWNSMTNLPWLMALLLFSVILSSGIAYVLTLWFGKAFSGIHQKIEYSKISKGIIVFLIILIFIFSGPVGLIVAAVSVAIGLIPPLYGIKRVHLMGCIIFPIILFITAFDQYLLGIF
ncbi:MAG: tripartite tricarboxylate transporter permease [Thermoplasmata archaeon]